VRNQFPENLIFVLDSFGKSYFQRVSNIIQGTWLSDVVLSLYNIIIVIVQGDNVRASILKRLDNIIVHVTFDLCRCALKISNIPQCLQ